MNGSTGWRGEIHAAVGRAGLAVQDAALAEVAARGHAVERHAEIPVPQFFRRHLVENSAQLVALFVRPLDLLRAGFDEFFTDFEPLDCELSGANGNLKRAPVGLVTRGLHVDEQGIAAGRFFQVDSNNGLAPVDGRNLTGLRGFARNLPERYVLRVPLSAQVGQRLAASYFQKEQAAL